MDDENASCTHNGEEDAHLSLLDLPVEIFLHICSFLDTSTLVHGLSLVCKQFYLNLNNDIPLWKARINRIWPDASNSLLHPARPDKLFWKLSCVAIEKQTALWKQQDSMKKLTITDQGRNLSMLLMHIDRTYIVSSSNGDLLCYKLSSREKLEKPSYEVIKTPHYERIHYLTAMDHTIYGCSVHLSGRTGNTVKSWKLMNTGLVKQGTYCTTKNYTKRSSESLECITSCPEQALFATASSDDVNGIVYVFDPRAGSYPIMRYNQPDSESKNKPVYTLVMDTEYILSTDGGTVFVWDQRAGRIMNSIPRKATPTCMSMRRDWVCVGDSKAKIHMLDPKKEFKRVKSYSTEHTGSITKVHLTHGCLITSCVDGIVRISSPTDPPKPIATLNSRLFGEITSMDYLNDTLAIVSRGRGGFDSFITLWRPKLTRSTKYQ